MHHARRLAALPLLPAADALSRSAYLACCVPGFWEGGDANEVVADRGRRTGSVPARMSAANSLSPHVYRRHAAASPVRRPRCGAPGLSVRPPVQPMSLRMVPLC